MIDRLRNSGILEFSTSEAYLYSLFFVHLLIYRFPALASSYLLISIAYVLVSKSSFKITSILTVLGALIISILSLHLGIRYRETAFFLWFLFLVVSFDQINLNEKLFLKYLNITYLIYLLLSILVTFKMINAGFMVDQSGLNQFDENLFGFSFVTLVGYSGTTAGIDAYSMLILIINMMFNRKRILFVLIPFFSIVWTTRMTPWAMVLIAVIYMMGFNKHRLLVWLFGIGIFLSFLVPLIFRGNTTLELVLFAASHGRSMIWMLYYDILVGYDISNLLFGIRESQLPEVYLGEWIGYRDSPHSSYFRILLAHGLLLYIGFFIFCMIRLLSARRRGRKEVIILVSILVAAITNENIFHNHNPIFLMSLLYFSLPFKDKPTIKSDHKN